MRFNRAVFHGGLNITVRHTMVWAERLMVDDYIHILDNVLGDNRYAESWLSSHYYMNQFNPQPKEEEMTIGRVAFVMACKFRDIPDCLLQFEHDPICQDRQGLKRTLMNAYPALNWAGCYGEREAMDEDLFTIVGFYIYKRS
jgi:hypothetical protein